MILKYQLVNRPSSETDIKEDVDYYKNISPEFARRFLFRIREAMASIAIFPFGFQKK